jgi:TolA-binding protein
MIRKLQIISMSLVLTVALPSFSQRARARDKAIRTTDSQLSNQAKVQLQRAIDLAKSSQYQAAANALYTMGRRSEFQTERAQIKYILGLMLMEMKLNQVAAYQFVDVIRLNNPRYTKLAVEKLSIVADGLGDDNLLNYAFKRLDVTDIPSGNRDMIHYRLGEVKLKNKDFDAAEIEFSKVQPGSSYYNQALYSRGVSLLERNRVNDAVAVFQAMLSRRSQAPVTDTNRVAAQIAIARALYQKADWDASILAYSQIPRDHMIWHDALFEQSWAMLRAARFRSALSNFQSLHSAYYENFYIPESLLLRATVYLFICKFDEMEKILQLFEKTYGPVSTKLKEVLRTKNNPIFYWNEIDKLIQAKKDDSSKNTLLPTIVVNYLMQRGDIKRTLNYLNALDEEKSKIETNASFKNSAIGKWSLKVLATRKKNTQIKVGEFAMDHLKNMRIELRDLYEQAGFIRYEMINGQKENLKKKIAGKELIEESVDDDLERSFFVQNGYEYYPFKGEFWLDEIGNYHYLGKSSCE